MDKKEASSVSGTTFKNLLWRFMERCGAQGVSFIVSIVLARLLDPDVYGTIALVTVFTAILQVFVDSGLGNSLIQKKDSDDIDFSTVFIFNLVSCAAIYTIMFIMAPYISIFYEKSELTAMIRVMSLTIIIAGIKNVQQAYVSKHLMFKKFFFATLGGTVGAAVIGIWMAYMGFGVWALIVQNVFNQAVDTTILWITVKWRPKALFSWQRFKGLYSYGWKLLVSSLLETSYRELRALIIGKKYTEADLAYYNKGNQFPNLIILNITTSIDSVLLPVMSAEQDDTLRVREITRRAIIISTYVIMPFMVGLAVCAEPMIRLLLTEKWLPCVPYLRIFCFSYAFYPIHSANLNAMKAVGRSDLFLKLEIIKKAIGLVSVIVTMWFGVIWMAASLIFTTVIFQIINAYPNKKLLNYSYISQLRDMLPSIVLSVAMGGVVYAISFFGLPDILTIIIQVTVGISFYLLASKILRLDPYKYITSALKRFLKKEAI